MKNKIKASFRIVTPMFIGDANHDATSVRPPSIKGALRFWWRALNWDQYAAEHGQDKAAALRDLHAEEARLFGLAAEKNVGGQGQFILSVTEQKVESVEQAFENMTPSQLYLLGMGLGSFKGGNHTLRSALKSNGTFNVEILFRPNCNQADKQSIANALYVFGLLGGLGSRVRHGLGSVALTSWESDLEMPLVPNNKAEYKAAIQTLIGSKTSLDSPITAFNRSTITSIAMSDRDALKLLDKVGTEMQMYRSFGRNGRVLNKSSERNFTSDHDLMLNAANGEKVNAAPKRVVFGLPHNYYFSSAKRGSSVDYGTASKAGRRASPLCLHIHQVSENECLAVHTLFESQFLPEDATLTIKSTANVSHVNPDADWQVIHNYLNRFKQSETILG